MCFRKCCSGDQIEKDERGGVCRKQGEIRNASKILARKTKWKRPIG
jgi:hypothetical protein